MAADTNAIQSKGFSSSFLRQKVASAPLETAMPYMVNREIVTPNRVRAEEARIRRDLRFQAIQDRSSANTASIPQLNSRTSTSFSSSKSPSPTPARLTPSC